MKHKLNEAEGIECVFINDEGKKITCFIPTLKLTELLQDEAYETITIPICNSSSCAVNNFCECDPVNEDFKFDHINVCIQK